MYAITTNSQFLPLFLKKPHVAIVGVPFPHPRREIRIEVVYMYQTGVNHTKHNMLGLFNYVFVLSVTYT